MKFSDRLKKATDRLNVEWGPTPLGKFLGVSKQTAERWMGDGQPSIEKLFDIADRCAVDPRWLATEEGDMDQAPALPPDLDQNERTLLLSFRKAEPRWQLALRLLAALATPDQVEVAGDINMVVARLVGMKPKDLKYPKDTVAEKKLGLPPGAGARKSERTTR